MIKIIIIKIISLALRTDELTDRRKDRQSELHIKVIFFRVTMPTVVVWILLIVSTFVLSAKVGI